MRTCSHGCRGLTTPTRWAHHPGKALLPRDACAAPSRPSRSQSEGANAVGRLPEASCAARPSSVGLSIAARRRWASSMRRSSTAGRCEGARRRVPSQQCPRRECSVEVVLSSENADWSSARPLGAGERRRGHARPGASRPQVDGAVPRRPAERLRVDPTPCPARGGRRVSIRPPHSLRRGG